MVRAQACHFLLHTNECEESNSVCEEEMLEASIDVEEVDLEIERLYHEIWLLETQTTRSKHQRQPSDDSNASTRASTCVGSLYRDSVLSHSIETADCVLQD